MAWFSLCEMGWGGHELVSTQGLGVGLQALGAKAKQIMGVPGQGSSESEHRHVASAAWSHIPAAGRKGLQGRAAGPHHGQTQLAGKGKAGRGGKVGHKQDGLMKGKPRCRRSLVSVGWREAQAAGWAPGIFSPCQDCKWPLPAQCWCTGSAWMVRVTRRVKVQL